MTPASVSQACCSVSKAFLGDTCSFPAMHASLKFLQASSTRKSPGSRRRAALDWALTLVERLLVARAPRRLPSRLAVPLIFPIECKVQRGWEFITLIPLLIFPIECKVQRGWEFITLISLLIFPIECKVQRWVGIYNPYFFVDLPNSI